MIVAVGSTRAPKLEAVRRVLSAPGPWGPSLAAAEVVPVDVGALAPVMPLSIDALCEGARVRAEHALAVVARGERAAELGVGLEGGLELRTHGGRRRGFLMAWVYVTDGRRGAFGCGGGLELPERLLGEVADGGVELGEAVDRLAGRRDVRSGEGAWGVLTRGALDRTRTFEIALVNALAPFYNREVYT